MTAGSTPGGLTVGTVRPAEEAIRILKRMRKEKSPSVRMAQLTAVEQLVESIRSHERCMCERGYRLPPPPSGGYQPTRMSAVDAVPPGAE